MYTWILILLVSFVLLVICAEVFFRRVLGLGNPPLWRFDDDYEYILKANQQCLRFGNRVLVNQWSMRSRETTESKEDPAELRILVLGDSIVNGGPRIDHDRLATTILENRLTESLHCPVWVGNIAAGSWGPPNLLAYVRKHGIFDADIVIIVVNSADYFKELQFRPLDPGRPDRKPLFAMSEIVGNYIRRRIRRRLRKSKIKATQAARTGAESSAAMKNLLEFVTSSGAKVSVIQHLGASEITGVPQTGYKELGEISRGWGVEPVSLAPQFRAALDRNESPYHDGLHPNSLGQELLADALYDEVEKLHQQE